MTRERPKQGVFVKDAEGGDMRYGLSMYRFSDGRLQRDWFRADAGSVDPHRLQLMGMAGGAGHEAPQR